MTDWAKPLVTTSFYQEMWLSRMAESCISPDMIVLEPGMRIKRLTSDAVTDALAESIRQRMDVERNPICEAGTIAFELGAQVSVLQPDGRKVFYSCDEIPAALESSRRMKTLFVRDNRAARATFFPKAKNRKCVG